jgi:hypothetical protein
MSMSGVSPHEARLEAAARALVIGAIVCGGGVLVVGLAVLIGWGDALAGLLMPGWSGTAAEGLVLAIGVLLLCAVALLYAAVGVLAREAWVLPALLLYVLAGAGAALLGITPGVVALGAALVALWLVRGDRRAFRLNPVLTKEMRGRMRGFRAFGVLTVYLVIMGAVTLLLYAIYGSIARSSGTAAVGEIGRALFYGVAGVELLLILFLAPSFTAGAIAGERERQTYDLLQTTLLTPSALILGKLNATFGFIVLLLAAGIPLQSLAFLFGGVTGGEIVISVGVLLATAVLLCAIGVFFSTVMARTITASARAYAVSIAALFIAPIVLALLASLFQDFAYTRLGFRPPPLVEAALTTFSSLLIGMNPASASITSAALLLDQDALTVYRTALRADGSTITLLSPWLTYILLAAGTAALLILASIRSAAHLRERDPVPVSASTNAPPKRKGFRLR